MKLEFVSDAAIAEVIGSIDFDAAVRAAYVAAAGADADHAPVLRLPGARAGEALNIKAGRSGALLGLKIGSYWAGNAAAGLPNHAATTLLYDPDTGFPRAVLGARLLNRHRTAAGNAVATDLLARADAAVLAVIGTGEQAAFEARAVARVRRLAAIRVGGRDPARSAALANALADLAPAVVATDSEGAVRGADIVVTATAARAPLVMADWVAPGTHIAAMGADAVGKQELDPALFARAALFADLPAQAAIVGEAQHAPHAATPIGDVIAGRATGRADASAITIFDSSGIAAQDLFVAEAALVAARAAGLVQQVEW